MSDESVRTIKQIMQIDIPFFIHDCHFSLARGKSFSKTDRAMCPPSRTEKGNEFTTARFKDIAAAKKVATQ